MVDTSGIRNGLAVIASDGEPVGAVDKVEGDRIKLTRKDSTDNEHHYIPLAWVARVEERVHLNRTGADVRASFGPQHAAAARAAGAHHDGERKTNWLAWIALALGLLALLWALSRCDREDPQATTATTTTTTETTAVDTSGVAVSGETAAAGTAAATATASSDVLSQMQAYLASTEAAGRRFTFDNIQFATSSAELPADAGTTIGAIAQALQATPNARIRVEGYADARGAEGANAQLGAQRAEAVARALIAAGVAANRVETSTGGEANPVDSNATGTGQAHNRRTDIVVTAK
jgi:outer membrane protein OmpA-like peptidoglycan-associated protein